MRGSGFGGSGFKVQRFKVQRFRVQGSEVQGSGVQGSAPPLAKPTAGQIEKRNFAESAMYHISASDVSYSSSRLLSRFQTRTRGRARFKYSCSGVNIDVVSHECGLWPKTGQSDQCQKLCSNDNVGSATVPIPLIAGRARWPALHF